MPELLEEAHQQSSITPEKQRFFRAVAVYPNQPGKIYHVYTAPAKHTVVSFGYGEKIEKVFFGEDARWLMEAHTTGEGVREQHHLLLGVTESGVENSLSVITSRGFYSFELHALDAKYMARVTFTYPKRSLHALRTKKNQHLRQAQQAIAKTHLVHARTPDKLEFGYHLISEESDTPRWRPTSIYHDVY